MRKIACLASDETGAQTVELVLWLPVICALVMIVVDTATLYLTHTEMWTVARDTARRMTTGQLASAQAAKEYAASAMSLHDYPYKVDAVYDPANAMQVEIGIKYSDIPIIGYSTFSLLGGTMTARVSMRSGPLLAAAYNQGISGGVSTAGTSTAGTSTGGTSTGSTSTGSTSTGSTSTGGTTTGSTSTGGTASGGGNSKGGRYGKKR